MAGVAPRTPVMATTAPIDSAWRQRGLLGSCSTPRSSRDSTSNPLAPSSPHSGASGWPAGSTEQLPYCKIYEWPTTRLPNDIVPPREHLRLLKALQCWLGPPMKTPFPGTLNRGLSAAASVRDGFPHAPTDTVSPRLQDTEQQLQALCQESPPANSSAAEVHATILALIDTYDVLCPGMVALANQMAEAADVWDSFAARPFYYNFQVKCGFRTVNGELPPTMRIAALRTALGSLAFSLGALHQFMRAIHVAALGGEIRRGCADADAGAPGQEGRANPHSTKTWAPRGLAPMEAAVATLEAVLGIGLSHLITLNPEGDGEGQGEGDKQQPYDQQWQRRRPLVMAQRTLSRVRLHWQQLFSAAVTHAEPQRRLWAYGLAWGTGLVCVGACLYSRRRQLFTGKWLREAQEFAADFTQTHLTDPARNIWHELYNRQHPVLGKADTIKIDLQRARADYHKIVHIWETAARASVVQYGSAEEAETVRKLSSLQLREMRLEEQVVDPVKSIVRSWSSPSTRPEYTSDSLENDWKL